MRYSDLSDNDKRNRERIVVQLGGTHGANMQIEDDPLELQGLDQLNLAEKYKDQVVEDLEFVQSLNTLTPNDVVNNMGEIKRKLKQLAGNPFLGAEYGAVLNRMSPYLDTETVDELIVEKAKAMHEINSQTVEKDWQTNIKAYETYVRAKPNPNLPINHPENIRINNTIAIENSKIASVAKAYEKAKQVYDEENVYFADDRDPDALMNVKANRMTIINKNGETIKITKDQYEEFCKDYEQKKNGTYNPYVEEKRTIVSVEDDEDLMMD